MSLLTRTTRTNAELAEDINTTGTAVITPAAVQAIVGAAVAAAVTND